MTNNNNQSASTSACRPSFQSQMNVCTVKMAASLKVLVYWTEDRQWSIVNNSAVPADVLPGQRTNSKGKLYPSIIIAKDCQTAIIKIEESFKEFLNSCLMEEAPEDVENCIIQYINENVKKTSGNPPKLTKCQGFDKSKGTKQTITKGQVDDTIDAIGKTKKKSQLDTEKLQAKTQQLHEIIAARKTQKSDTICSSPESPLPTAYLLPLPCEQTPPSSKQTYGSFMSLLQQQSIDYSGMDTGNEYIPLLSSYELQEDKNKLVFENEQLKIENEQLKAENATLKQKIADNSLPVTPRKVTFLKCLATRLEMEQAVLNTEQCYKRQCRKSLQIWSTPSTALATCTTTTPSASPSQLGFECSSMTSPGASPSQLNCIESSSQLESPSLNEWEKTVTDKGIKKVLLMKGYNVYIPQTKLSTAILVGTCPRQLVIQLLECFFSREQLAVSNATGKRQAHNSLSPTKPLNKIVLQAILDFVLLKFKKDSGEPVLSVTAFNGIVNSKCATARRGLKQ